MILVLKSGLSVQEGVLRFVNKILGVKQGMEGKGGKQGHLRWGTGAFEVGNREI